MIQGQAKCNQQEKRFKFDIKRSFPEEKVTNLTVKIYGASSHEGL